MADDDRRLNDAAERFDAYLEALLGDGRPSPEAVGDRDEVAAIELNVSCPNVKSGLIVGEQPAETLALCEALRPLTPKPLIVKLTPNTADPAAVALAGVPLRQHEVRPVIDRAAAGIGAPAVPSTAVALPSMAATSCGKLFSLPAVLKAWSDSRKRFRSPRRW